MRHSGRGGVVFWRAFGGWLVLAAIVATRAEAAFSPDELTGMASPSRVLAEVRGSDKLDTLARQMATLEILSSVVQALGQTSPTEWQGREEQQLWTQYEEAGRLRYVAAEDILDPKRRRAIDDQTSSVSKWYRVMTQYQMNDALIQETLQRYTPASVRERYLERRAGERAEYQADVRKTEETAATILSRYHYGNFVLWLAAVVLPPLRLLRRKPAAAANASDTALLPEPLRCVQVLGKEYEVSWESGIVFNQEAWTDTHVSTTHTPGSSYFVGNVEHRTAGSTYTSVSTTLMHRYWLRTADGRETSIRVPNDTFQATNGQLVSTIRAEGRILLIYNHATGSLAAPPSWRDELHRPRIGRAWFMTLALAFVGYFVSSLFAVGPALVHYFWIMERVLGFLALIAVSAGLSLAMTRAFVRRRRNRSFAGEYVPRIRAFLRDATPDRLRQVPIP